MRLAWTFTICASTLVLTDSIVFASLDTIGPNGINSAGLTLFNGMPLNGDGILVGQVEDPRPAVPGYDDPLKSNSFIHSFIQLASTSRMAETRHWTRT